MRSFADLAAFDDPYFLYAALGAVGLAALLLLAVAPSAAGCCIVASETAGGFATHVNFAGQRKSGFAGLRSSSIR